MHTKAMMGAVAATVTALIMVSPAAFAAEGGPSGTSAADQTTTSAESTKTVTLKASDTPSPQPTQSTAAPKTDPTPAAVPAKDAPSTPSGEATTPTTGNTPEPAGDAPKPATSQSTTDPGSATASGTTDGTAASGGTASDPSTPADSSTTTDDPASTTPAADGSATTDDPASTTPAADGSATTDDSGSTTPAADDSATTDGSTTDDPASSTTAPVAQNKVAKAVADVASDSTSAGSTTNALTPTQVKKVATAVCPSGAICVDQAGEVANAYADIQSAINAAKAGQTIVVYSGDYDPFTVTLAVQIMAAQGADVVVRTTSTNEVAVTIKADNVKVDGIGTDCSSSDYATGFDVTNRKNTTISNAIAYNCQFGVNISNSSKTTVADSMFVNENRERLSVGVIGNNATDTTVKDSFFSGLDNGVALSSFTNATISNNDFFHNDTAGYFEDGKNLTFDNNLVLGSNQGASIDGVQSVRLTKNTIAFGNSGFTFTSLNGPSSDVVIDGNTFAFLDGFGLNFGSNTLDGTAIVQNNDFIMDPLAITVDSKNGGYVDATKGNDFGGCGAWAVDQGFNGGGSIAVGNASVLGIDKAGCKSAPTTSKPAGSKPEAAGPTTTTLPRTGADDPLALMMASITLMLAGAVAFRLSRRSAQR